jgi:hypothetical protein
LYFHSVYRIYSVTITIIKYKLSISIYQINQLVWSRLNFYILYYFHFLNWIKKFSSLLDISHDYQFIKKIMFNLWSRSDNKEMCSPTERYVRNEDERKKNWNLMFTACRFGVECKFCSTNLRMSRRIQKHIHRVEQ